MPAQSKSQQRLFGMALAYKKGKDGFASKKVKEIAKKMSKEDIEDFASTKHKGLKNKVVKKKLVKENRAFSFEEFINEAHIDAEGKLQDFEVTDKDMQDLEYEQGARDYNKQKEVFIKNTKDFFESHDAKDIYVSVKGPIMHVAFDFYDKQYGIVSDIDRGYTELAELDKSRETGANVIAQFSDYGILIDLIKDNGLYFIKNIK